MMSKEVDNLIEAVCRLNLAIQALGVGPAQKIVLANARDVTALGCAVRAGLAPHAYLSWADGGFVGARTDGFNLYGVEFTSDTAFRAIRQP